jgi:hypothetical protein
VLIVAAIEATASPWLFSTNNDGPRVLTSSCSSGNTCNVALIKPTFTAAAYHHSFYKFYFLYASITHAKKNITTDLNLLSSKVTNQTSRTSSAALFPYLAGQIRTLLPKSNIIELSDADADNYNSMFLSNGTNRYGTIILGHQEYVTQREYDNLKHFVANGGILILMDGNVFYTQVKYDRNTHTITLVKGHGWAYNGKSAWRSVRERWADETSQWVGSNYLCYSCKVAMAGNAFQYRHHEEQRVTNPNDRILVNYNASIAKVTSKLPTKVLVASYVLNFQKGKVIALGIYSDDLIGDKKFENFFDDILLQKNTL